MKNIFMYIIVIAVVAVGGWLFMRKGSNTGSLYDASPSPSTTADASASASPVAAVAVSPTTSPAGKVITTASGLQYQDEVVGTGAPAKSGQMVAVNYTGTLTNGTKFDSSFDHNPPEPIIFQLGVGQVIKGWDEGLSGMKVGGKRKLVIPASLAYGSQSPSPLIPANSVLVFEVELVGIK